MLMYITVFYFVSDTSVF